MNIIMYFFAALGILAFVIIILLYAGLKISKTVIGLIVKVGCIKYQEKYYVVVRTDYATYSFLKNQYENRNGQK